MFNAGEVFNPDFINLMQPFKIIRMMNWQNIIATAMNDWNFRRSPTWIFYNDSPSIALKYNGPAGTIVFDGPPIEVQVALCNKVSADCWFNIPPLADDTYITNMATLVHNGTTDSSGYVWAKLNSGLKAYVEFGNEFWNTNFCAPPGGSFTEYCEWVISDLDISFYPQNDAGLANKPFDQEKDYQGLQSVRSANMWRTAWGGDSGRIVGVYGGAGFDTSPGGTVQSSVIWGLATTDPGPNGIGPTYYTGTKQSNLNALAISTYIGNGGCPGADLNAFFTQANIDETAAVAEMTANNSAYGPFPILIYESGFQYTGGAALCISAMRDARAGAMYTDFYTRLKAAGNGGVMMHFDNIGPWNNSGFYQALEDIIETSSPRYNALKAFH